MSQAEKRDWRTNQEAVKQTKELLEGVGLPLEFQVGALCRAFAESCSRRPRSVQAQSQRIVYTSGNGEDKVREIDQVIRCIRFIELPSASALVELQIPIECKFRKDVEFFAFPEERPDLHSRFPLWSDMYGSGLFRSLEFMDKHLEQLMCGRIVAVKMKRAKGPTDPPGGSGIRGAGVGAAEELVPKAAGALYDFIEFMLTSEEASESHHLNQELNRRLKSHVKKFQRSMRRVPGQIDMPLLGWIRALPEEECEQFDSAAKETSSGLAKIQAFFPIVCVGGPLYRTTWEPTEGIGEFEDLACCLTSIHKHGWRGDSLHKLRRKFPEVPVVVTNPTHLPGVLETGFSWFQGLCDLVARASERHLKRWRLESSLFQVIRREYPRSAFFDPTRSTDADLEGVFQP